MQFEAIWIKSLIWEIQDKHRRENNDEATAEFIQWAVGTYVCFPVTVTRNEDGDLDITYFWENESIEFTM